MKQSRSKNLFASTGQRTGEGNKLAVIRCNISDMILGMPRISTGDFEYGVVVVREELNIETLKSIMYYPDSESMSVLSKPPF